MPELPEVHTTVQGLNLRLKNLTIRDVWSCYKSTAHTGKENIKNPLYFKKFRKSVVGATFVGAERRGKNILIYLSNEQTILVHMKMTGHLMYGKYTFESTHTDRSTRAGKVWRATEPGPLQDPFNQYIRLVFSLSDKNHLAFSDLRKFAKVFVFPTEKRELLPDLIHIGPEPLDSDFTFSIFKARLARWPTRPIKQVLMDQSVIAGIGNIYSDEMLWAASIHPLSRAPKISEKSLKKLFKEMKIVLARGINFGGDSDSDYRNIDGVPGKFQNKHNVYRRTGKICPKQGCGGTINRIKIGGRSGHFCPKHQTMFR